MAFTTFLLTVVSVFIVEVTGNLMCVCNKDNVQQIEVFISADSNSTVIGHLNPHQCRTYVSASNQSWYEIQLNGEEGYIQNDGDLLLEADCPGTDILPTTPILLTSTMAAASTTPHCMEQSVSMDKGDVTRCPEYVVLGAKSHCRLLTKHHHHCYEFTLDRVSWAHANQLCIERGGHLVTINNAQENTYLHSILTQLNHTRRAWIGLQDQQTEGQFSWVSGEKVSYTNFSNSSLHDGHGSKQDCVAILPSGEWDDELCETTWHAHPYICEYTVHFSESAVIG